MVYKEKAMSQNYFSPQFDAYSNPAITIAIKKLKKISKVVNVAASANVLKMLWLYVRILSTGKSINLKNLLSAALEYMNKKSFSNAPDDIV